MTVSERTRQLVRMLASPVDGEALAACRALGRQLQREKLSFNDMADLLGAPARASSNSHRAYQERKPEIRPEVRDLIARGESAWRPREWEFLQSLAKWRGDFTEKQAKWLADLKMRKAA